MTRANSDIAQFVEASATDDTRRQYGAHLVEFVRWCVENNRLALPLRPEDLADYIRELAGPPRNLGVSAIARRCSAIVGVHRFADRASPLRGAAKEAMAEVREQHSGNMIR